MGDPIVTDRGQEAAAAENAAVAEAQTATFRAARKNDAVAILPGGRRVTPTRHISAAYEMQDEVCLLCAPETIISEEYRREHPGWHYAWPVRVSNKTASYLRARWYHAVPFDAIDKENPIAVVADLPTPAGTHVVWMQHILVAIPPEVWDKLVTRQVDFAVERTAVNREALEAKMDAEFSRGGYKAQVDAFTDRRSSRTGE